MKHATVMRDGFEVPLIGIPEEAVMDTCDTCGVPIKLPEVYTDGDQFLCKKCAGNDSPDSHGAMR